MNLRIGSRVPLFGGVLVVFLLSGGYVQYRSNIHRAAPEFIQIFLNTMAARWALEDIQPFFSVGLSERKSEVLWRERLGCYKRLGAPVSHTKPGTSDTGMFGRVLYSTDVSFQNGDAEVFLWLDKSWGKLVVDEIYVKGAKASHIGDHSWCSASTKRRAKAYSAS